MPAKPIWWFKQFIKSTKRPELRPPKSSIGQKYAFRRSPKPAKDRVCWVLTWTRLVRLSFVCCLCSVLASYLVPGRVCPPSPSIVNGQNVSRCCVLVWSPTGRYLHVAQQLASALSCIQKSCYPTRQFGSASWSICPALTDAKACPLFRVILHTLPQIALYHASNRSDLVFLVLGRIAQCFLLP